jgi:general secretion pathway protein N
MLARAAGRGAKGDSVRRTLRRTERSRTTMRKSGLPVPIAALLCGILAAGAGAQETGRGLAELAAHPLAAAKTEPLAGNPLWAIPLRELSETHARPLFSPSRRPPAPPVLAAAAASPVKRTPPAKSGPDHPLLTLLGTIVGDVVEIGVFTDEVSHDVIRIRAGEAHDGWTLSAVSGRAAIFQKQGYPAAALVLPAAGADANAPSVANKFATPVIPAATKGGSKRPPREG